MDRNGRDKVVLAPFSDNGFFIRIRWRIWSSDAMAREQ